MKNKYVLNLEDIPVKQAHMFNLNKLNEFLTGKLEGFDEISNVGGIEIFIDFPLLSKPLKSLNILSLPEIKGVL